MSKYIIPLTEKLLLLFADFLDFSRNIRSVKDVVLLDDPYFHRERIWMSQYIYNKKKKIKLQKTIHALKRRGYLQNKIFRKRMGYIITPKGEDKLFKLKLQHKSRTKLARGQWLVVFFDIPEEMKETRNIFRSQLQILGFEQLQKSVWATQFNVVKELEELRRLYRIEKYAKPLIVKEFKE